MRVLITGSDGSLGAFLCSTSAMDVLPLPNEIMQGGKQAIELAIFDEHITHVINNYGTNHLSWIGQTDEEDEQILVENVMPAYWVINHLATRDTPCRVVNIASATYRVPQRCTALYCASKAAVVQMTKVMARELAPKGWVINALAPGLIADTKMAALVRDQVMDLRGWSAYEAHNHAMDLVPMGRATTKAEVATAIWKVLALPDYINGACIDMMGGV